MNRPMMSAGVIQKLGEAPAPGQLPEPVRGDGQVLVRLATAALNPFDLGLASGTHRLGAPAVPHVPGIEGVGTVVAGNRPAGLRVRVQTPGTLGAVVAVDPAACAAVPDGLGDDEAAAIGIVGLSALIALRDRVVVGPGDRVLVLGASGPFGQALVQVARSLGAARVVAAGRDRARLAPVADRADDLVELGPDLPGSAGPVDVVVDPLGGPWFEAALRCLAPGGRYLNVGEAAGRGAAIDPALLRERDLTVRGFSAVGVPTAEATAAYADVAALATAGGLRLNVATYSLDRVAEAWADQAASPGAKIVVRH